MDRDCSMASHIACDLNATWQLYSSATRIRNHEWALKIYIHLPAAFPLLNTSSTGSIGIDFGGAGQWDSSYWHDMSMLSSSVHSSWRNFCIPRRWTGRSVCRWICLRKPHIQYAADSVQNFDSPCPRRSPVWTGVPAGWGSAECEAPQTPPAAALSPAALLGWGRSEVLRPRLPADLARR